MPFAIVCVKVVAYYQCGIPRDVGITLCIEVGVGSTPYRYVFLDNNPVLRWITLLCYMKTIKLRPLCAYHMVIRHAGTRVCRVATVHNDPYGGLPLVTALMRPAGVH